VRIRILEQEAERHLRRVQSLEHQLAEMERKTQERMEQVHIYMYLGLDSQPYKLAWRKTPKFCRKRCIEPEQGPKN
jgi:hypothetical protein